MLERNVDAIAAEIGTSLAGLGFVPCDISQPLSRITEIVADSEPVCIMVHRSVAIRLALDNAFAAPVLILDDLCNGWAPEASIHNNVSEYHSKIAYTIYTSGSTGKPKGIVIGHESIIQLIQNSGTWSGCHEVIHSVVTTNLAWDPTLCQIYVALATGGCVKLPKLDGEKDGEYLSALMRQAPRVNCMLTTPGAVRLWLDQTLDQSLSFFPDDMRCIVLGGDDVTVDLVSQTLAATTNSPNVRVVQVYGPTEGTVFSSYGSYTSTNLKEFTLRRRLPIDSLLPNAAMTVVNAAGNELPRGFVGEIVIWGPCLMLGYNKLPQLNEQKMLVKNGARGWRSGDLGRHLPSGGFEILGRMDSMCKIRGGFRVDLSEIGVHVRSYEQVAQCHISVMQSRAEALSIDRRIVAYVKFEVDSKISRSEDKHWTPSTRPKTTVLPRALEGLYRHLCNRIPIYMIPDFVVPVDGLPMINSTKVDKSKLPDPTTIHRFTTMSRNSKLWTAEDEDHRDTIAAILGIFSRVLMIDRPLSPDDNFYDCGGHSLLAARVTSLIRRDLDVPLPFTAPISNPTTRELAKFVESLKLHSTHSDGLPPHIIPLQPTGVIAHSRALLFVFPFVGGNHEILPGVVNDLDNVNLGLATYAICWEPGQNLDTLDKAARAYARSIALLAESRPCILLGWCFGGIIASKASSYLPRTTTHVILLDAPHPSILLGRSIERDFAETFAEYLCRRWFAVGLPSVVKSEKEDAIMRAVLDTKVHWHDIPGLLAIARRYITLPPRVTEFDLEQRLLPLADGHDILADVLRHSAWTPAECIDLEERVALNLQATEGLSQMLGLELGLGWTRFEIIEADNDRIGYLPLVGEKIISSLGTVLF